MKLIDPLRHRQLFLDDHAIGEAINLRRTLHQPTKYGPVLRPDRDRGEKYVQSTSSPQWNPERKCWEWWYNAFTTYGDISHNLYASSTDGLHWDRPGLGRYEWHGSRENNVAYASEEWALCHTLRDDIDPDPGRRYKAFFTAKTNFDRWPGISPDGFDWTVLDVPPIPSQDTSQLIYDEIGARYLATVKHRTAWGRSAWLVTSGDFVHWTAPELILHTDEIDQANRQHRIDAVVQDPAYLSPPIVDGRNYIAQLYMMPVMPYEGAYIGFPLLFNPSGPDPSQMNHTGLNQVELAVSRDAYHWQRVADRSIFIGVEPWNGGSNYATAQVAVCNRPIVRDDEIWIYYMAARSRGHRDLFAGLDPAIYNDDFFDDCGALYLTRLRRDGFVSLDAADEGVLLTKPFRVAGDHLYVNAEVADGELCAEIVDAATLIPQPGFSVHECIPLQGDHLQGRVEWSKHTPLPREAPVRLRFYLRHARLYSFWLAAQKR